MAVVAAVERGCQEGEEGEGEGGAKRRGGGRVQRLQLDQMYEMESLSKTNRNDPPHSKFFEVKYI